VTIVKLCRKDGLAMTCKNLRQTLRDHESGGRKHPCFAYRCLLRSDAGFCPEIARKLAKIGVVLAGPSQDCPFEPADREQCPSFSS
jgi:hypothetical protein